MSAVKINVQTLTAIGIDPILAKLFSEPLRFACDRFDINTLNRVASFLAQAMHESAEFTRLEENLHYTSPERICKVFPSRVHTLGMARPLCRNPQALANRVYSGRLGNGDLASGDGWAFRGRGLFQLTGRTNYTKADQALGIGLVLAPHLVAQPNGASLTAAWFWSKEDCNRLADTRNTTAITRRINGPALLGLDARVALETKIRKVLG